MTNGNRWVLCFRRIAWKRCGCWRAFWGILKCYQFDQPWAKAQCYPSDQLDSCLYRLYLSLCIVKYYILYSTRTHTHTHMYVYIYIYIYTRHRCTHRHTCILYIYDYVWMHCRSCYVWCLGKRGQFHRSSHGTGRQTWNHHESIVSNFSRWLGPRSNVLQSF